jgi:hypothetical protein
VGALSWASIPVGVELGGLASSFRHVLEGLVGGDERSIRSAPHEREVTAETLRVIDLLDPLARAVLDCSEGLASELIRLSGMSDLI